MTSDLEQIKKTLDEREAALRASEDDNRKARAKLEQDKQALATVMQLAGIFPEPSNGALPTPAAHGDVKRAFEAALTAVPAKFNTRELLDEMSKSSGLKVEKNRGNILGYLRRAQEAGRIETVKKGKGSRPTTYRKK